MNCSVKFLQENKAHSIAQTVILSVFLAGILLLNGMAIVITMVINFYNTKFRCSVRRMFLSSYIGNILGGTSLLINDIMYTKHGLLQVGCQQSMDGFFFLYLGVAINMIIIVSNTYVRYHGMKSFKRVTTPHTNKEILLRFTLPAWIVATCVAAALAIASNRYKSLHQAYLCVGLSVPSLLVAIACNIRLNKALTNAQRNTTIAGRTKSARNVHKAQTIIKTTIGAHCVLVILGLTSSVLMKFTGTVEESFIACTWTMRFIYIFMFSIEAEVFFQYTPQARRRILKLCRRKSNESNDESYKMSNTSSTPSEKR